MTADGKNPFSFFVPLEECHHLLTPCPPPSFPVVPFFFFLLSLWMLGFDRWLTRNRSVWVIRPTSDLCCQNRWFGIKKMNEWLTSGGRCEEEEGGRKERENIETQRGEVDAIGARCIGWTTCCLITAAPEVRGLKITHDFFFTIVRTIWAWKTCLRILCSWCRVFFRSFGIHAKRGEVPILGVFEGRRTKHQRGPSRQRNGRWICLLLCLVLAVFLPLCAFLACHARCESDIDTPTRHLHSLFSLLNIDEGEGGQGRYELQEEALIPDQRIRHVSVRTGNQSQLHFFFCPFGGDLRDFFFFARPSITLRVWESSQES